MKDIVYVENSYSITLREHSFRFYNYISKKEIFYPSDEIEFLVIDNQKTLLSSKVISFCAENNIGVIFCDYKHSPIASLYTGYSQKNKLERLILQLKVTQKTKDRLWKKIVTAKIKNQAKCLELCTNNIEKVTQIESYLKNITEGDRSNRESIVARIYFGCLFGNDFKRGRYDDKINAGLNYGYSILRSVIRRELSVHGFEQAFGIFHKSTENPFNLSDDIIEPFRPFVDAYVADYIIKDESFELLDLHKKKLINILLEHCVIDGKVMSICDAISLCVSSLIKCYEENSATFLKLPLMLEGGR